MQLDVKQIEWIANLARLDLTAKEEKMYAEQLSAVLDYVETLNEVDTEGVAETCQVTGLEDVAREDVAVESGQEAREKLLKLFPERKGDLLKVKAVFND